MNYIVAIDIGGTFTKLAVVSSQGQLMERKEQETAHSCQEFMDSVRAYYEQQRKQYEIQGIALSSPGSVTDAGDILGCSSAPFIHEQNLMLEIEKEFHLPASIENDANCAALAEMWNGAAQQVGTYACIVCGTGIGGALVIDQKLYKGVHLHGGDFGYAILASDLTSGSYMTWSEGGSSSALTRRLQEEAPFYEAWTGQLVFQQASQGHAAARKSLDTFFHTLAVGIFNIQYIVDPEKIFIGGGITRQPSFMAELDTQLTKLYEAKPFARIRPSVALCYHRDQAQLYGAAYVWFEKYGKRGAR
ncbi:ROK family protein [Caldalkalibacillus mannanilyticus]|uniref:ROK family protein n=1 Tax=Caldalkalibacillus mannanilyticus TaxID=1418 RepID=UPI0004690003|nr:ROK family protein [Caldalkalibacillus mannanilyticus]